MLLDVLCTGVNEETLTGDLLLDASLLVWEKICDVFKGITHNVISKSVLGSSKVHVYLPKSYILFNLYFSVLKYWEIFCLCFTP